MNGEARARQSRKIVFLFGKKKDFSGFGGSKTTFQRFRRFCESEKGRHASSRVFCSVLKKMLSGFAESRTIFYTYKDVKES